MDNKLTKIQQCEVDYGNVMKFEILDGSQILNKRITDTYITQDKNEEKMIQQLDRDVTYTYSMRHGFTGYLSWCYAQMTLFFLLEDYDSAIKILNKAKECVQCIESFCMTGNYKDSNNNDTEFINFSFGESDENMQKTLKYAKDCYQNAKLIHKKASSFESGYAFIVASILYDLSDADTSSALKECKHMNDLIDDIISYINETKNNKTETNIKEDNMSYSDVKSLSSK